MEWVDDFIQAYPKLSCKELFNLICYLKPRVVSQLNLDLEEYICARRGEIEEAIYGDKKG